jgi:hypothetical protein
MKAVSLHPRPIFFSFGGPLIQVLLSPLASHANRQTFGPLQGSLGVNSEVDSQLFSAQLGTAHWMGLMDLILSQQLFR